MTVLLREAIGDRLRHARTNQRRTLRDISRAARVSLGYLSEVERGQKEASSELLASICGALELPLAELLQTVASDISLLEALDTREVQTLSPPLSPPLSPIPAQSPAATGPNGKLVPALRTTIAPVNKPLNKPSKLASSAA